MSATRTNWSDDATVGRTCRARYNIQTKGNRVLHSKGPPGSGHPPRRAGRRPSRRPPPDPLRRRHSGSRRAPKDQKFRGVFPQAKGRKKERGKAQGRRPGWYRTPTPGFSQAGRHARQIRFDWQTPSAASSSCITARADRSTPLHAELRIPNS